MQFQKADCNKNKCCAAAFFNNFMNKSERNSSSEVKKVKIMASVFSKYIHGMSFTI
jgi:hypothetical protein